MLKGWCCKDLKSSLVTFVLQVNGDSRRRKCLMKLSDGLGIEKPDR